MFFLARPPPDPATHRRRAQRGDVHVLWFHPARAGGSLARDGFLRKTWWHPKTFQIQKYSCCLSVCVSFSGKSVFSPKNAHADAVVI